MDVSFIYLFIYLVADTSSQEAFFLHFSLRRDGNLHGCQMIYRTSHPVLCLIHYCPAPCNRHESNPLAVMSNVRTQIIWIYHSFIAERVKISDILDFLFYLCWTPYWIPICDFHRLFHQNTSFSFPFVRDTLIEIEDSTKHITVAYRIAIRLALINDINHSPRHRNQKWTSKKRKDGKVKKVSVGVFSIEKSWILENLAYIQGIIPFPVPMIP